MSPSVTRNEPVLEQEFCENGGIPDPVSAEGLLLEIAEQLNQMEIRDVLVRIISESPV